ncbi:serine/threonine protein kinase [Candidatus Sumerlaeota bacterium]|nr:serine/threonine protein kinase [Candidatus Sumerlaeota bacterium]
MSFTLPFIIDDKYRCESIIGKGGMGTVYKAVQLNMGNRLVAIKVLNEDLAGDEEFRKRFENEANTVGQLQHENIVQIYDRLDYEHTYCIVMEFVDGESLQRIIDHAVETNTPLSDARVVRIGAQVARALKVANDGGITHRDIKPDNILVLKDDTVKITDFGIALREDSTIKTQTGVSLGTPKFMSPEQVIGRGVDGQSDLYSLGVCLYYALTCRVPYDAENPIAVATKHLYETPEPISKFNSSCRPALAQVVMEAMAKQKPDRFANGDEMAQALEASLGDGATVSIETPRPHKSSIMEHGVVMSESHPHTPTRGIKVGIGAGRDKNNSTGIFRFAKPLMSSLWPAIVAVLIVIGIVGASLLVQRSTVSDGRTGANGTLARPGMSKTDTSVGSIINNVNPFGREIIYPDRITAEYKTMLYNVDQLTSQGEIIKARQLMEDFHTKRPDFHSDEIDMRLDLLTSQLPLSVADVQKLLAARRERKGVALLSQTPPNLPLGLAYMTAARDMFKGLTGTYEQEAEIGLLESQVKATTGTVNNAAFAKLSARADEILSQMSIKSAPVPSDAEDVLSQLISQQPTGYSRWIELAEVFRRQGYTDDARVLLQYVERQAPLSGDERKIAGRLYRSLEKQTVPE